LIAHRRAALFVQQVKANVVVFYPSGKGIMSLDGRSTEQKLSSGWIVNINAGASASGPVLHAWLTERSASAGKDF
jgi:hypothetical protein